MSLPIVNFLANYYFIFIRALLLAGVALFVINCRIIIELFKGVAKKEWFILLFIMGIGLAIRIWLVPHVHHVYFDEFEHINIATNMANHGKFFLTYNGDSRYCLTWTFPLFPPAYHTIAALFFSLFGICEAVAYSLSVAMATLSLGVIFLVAYLLFNNTRIALAAAGILSLAPVHLKYSGATELGIPTVLFILIAIFFMLIYARLPRISTLFLCVISCVFAVYGRFENGILVLLPPLTFWVIYQKNNNENIFFTASNKGYYWHVVLGILLLLVLMAPYFLQLYGAPHFGIQETMLGRWQNIKNNLCNNLLFWFSSEHPTIFTLLAICGIYYGIKRYRRATIALLLWFFIFLALYSQYHYGKFIIPDNDRYSLTLYISLAILGGIGLVELLRKSAYRKAVFICLLSYTVLEVASSLHFGVQETFQRDVYQEYQFILSSREKIPDDSYIIAFNPASIISTIHKKAICPDVFLRLRKLPKEAILFKDYWWFDKRKESQILEDRLKEIYDFIPLLQQKVSEEKTFSFIKLVEKESNR